MLLRPPRRRSASSVALLVTAALTMCLLTDVASASTSARPWLAGEHTRRGGAGFVFANGLTPGAHYVVSSAESIFTATNDTTVTSVGVVADKDGYFRSAVHVPQDLAITTDAIDITLATSAGAAVASGELPVDPPSFGVLCPSQSVRPRLVGFPPGTYALSSADATFAPTSVTIAADGTASDVVVTPSAGAPDAFQVEATRTDVAPQQDFTLKVGYFGQRYANLVSTEVEPDRVTLAGGCFGANRKLTVTSASANVHLAQQVVTDAAGNFALPGRIVSGADPVVVRVDVADPGSGLTATAYYSLEPTTLKAGHAVRAKGLLVSPNQRHSLYMAQHYCAAELSGPSEEVAYAASTSPCSLALRTDGNLVLASTSGKVEWSAGTQRTGAHDRLTVTNDGDVVLYSASGQVLWSAKHGRYQLASGASLARGQSIQTVNTRLLLRDDGNLVLSRLGKVRWASHTAGQHVVSLVMQADGSLVLRRADGSAAWSSRTAGRGAGGHLLVQDTHSAARIVDAHGRTIWSIG